MDSVSSAVGTQGRDLTQPETSVEGMSETENFAGKGEQKGTSERD